MSAECPDDPTELDARTFATEGGRYGARRYRERDGREWTQYWGTRAESWGGRVFATLAEAARYVNSRTTADE